MESFDNNVSQARCYCLLKGSSTSERKQHSSHIMNPEFTEMGAAIQGSYSVMVFGNR